MTNQKLKEFIDWQDAGGEIEYLVCEELNSWVKVTMPISVMRFWTRIETLFRKKEKPKLTHGQIMNEWLWFKVGYAFKIYKYSNEKYYWYPDYAKKIDFMHRNCELYTGQDKENNIGEKG